MIARFLFLLFLLASLPCFAEVLRPMDFEGQPVILVTDGKISLCGIRFFGVESPVGSDNKNAKIWASDASVSITSGRAGLVKATALQSTIEKIEKKVDPSVQEISTFWIKTSGSDASYPLDGVTLNGDELGSKMYPTDGRPVVAIIKSIFEGNPVQLGFRFADSTRDFAFYGKVSLTLQDANQVRSCIGELVNGVKY